ncbi:MAG: hypothetical protein ACOC0G_01190 [Thermodesulfobacteriota bacterium]
MAFFFPEHLKSTRYASMYAELSAVERIILMREFIGVTYRNRYLFFQRHDYHARYVAPFCHNLQVAARLQYKRMHVPRRVWRKHTVVPQYLRLIYRHYVLGFALQLLRKHHSRDLLPPRPGCYPDAVYVLDALNWFLTHEEELEREIEAGIDAVMADDIRSLYVYCLQCYALTRNIMECSGPHRPGREMIRNACIGGNIPLGAELEFSNLGHRASFDHMFLRHARETIFHNFVYFHHFFLGDVSWRLGGYLDHHVRLRRYLPVPWIGGFFEYALVRLDYPRRFSMPLTCDPGFLAQYLKHVIRFAAPIEPHSLHVNIEQVFSPARDVPALSDYQCLLLLGGDMQVDEDGKIREQRLCHHELMKMVRQRRHLSLFDNQRHLVNEYAFLRLHEGCSSRVWRSIILALKGFNAVSLVGEDAPEPINDLARWARRPEGLTREQLRAFVKRVRHGLELEQVYSPAKLNRYMEDLMDILIQENQRLSSPV